MMHDELTLSILTENLFNTPLILHFVGVITDEPSVFVFRYVNIFALLALL